MKINFELLVKNKKQFLKHLFYQRSEVRKRTPFPALKIQFSILKIQQWLLKKMGKILQKKYFDRRPGCGKNNSIFVLKINFQILDKIRKILQKKFLIRGLEVEEIIPFPV